MNTYIYMTNYNYIENKNATKTYFMPKNVLEMKTYQGN